jgi:hypothetical protein
VLLIGICFLIGFPPHSFTDGFTPFAAQGKAFSGFLRRHGGAAEFVG